MAELKNQKIVHVYKDYYPPVAGGIEKNINCLCRHLHRDGYHVEVLIANRSRKDETQNIDGIPIIKAGQWGRIMSAPITPGFAHWLKKVQGDIYHFHHPNPTAELAWLQAGCPGKAVVTYHSDIVRQSLILPLYKPFLYQFLRKVKTIIATSPNYIESSPILQDFRDKTVVNPLGIEPENYLLPSEYEIKVHEIREKHPAKLRILFVGRLRYYKGLSVLLEAMKGLPDAHLTIVGTAPKTGGEKIYFDKVNELGISKQILFTGELSDSELLQQYYACDVFCLPSIQRSEAFGLVQLEAHCCGKPVISTNLDTGVPYVNQNGKTGLIVSPNNPGELREALQKLMINPDLRNSMGSFARKRVLQDFTAQRMYLKTLEIYQSALNT